MSEEWLADTRRLAEAVAKLDKRHAASDLERMAIDEAGVILWLIAEVVRLQTERANAQQ